MASSIVNLLRVILLAVVTAFAAIALGLAAHSISVTTTYSSAAYLNFDALAVATAALTIATLPPLIAFSLMRKGAFPNFIAVEMAWFCVLSILWLAAAADTANATSRIPDNCSLNFVVLRKTLNFCEFPALQAFAWLNWILLMGYVILTLVLTIIQQTRGNSLWLKSVNEVDFFAPPAPQQQQPQMYAPQQQQQPQMHVPQQQQVQMGYAPGTPQTGYSSPQQGYTQPTQQGYNTPPQQGYSPPPQQGYPPSLQQDYAPQVQTLGQAPVNTGYPQV